VSEKNSGKKIVSKKTFRVGGELALEMVTVFLTVQPDGKGAVLGGGV